MLFFKRILKESAATAKSAAWVERRSARRFAINPKFPLKAVLSFTGREGSRAPVQPSRPPMGSRAPVGRARPGWTWKGRLLDCSGQGARIQMAPTQKVEARDLCDLRLTVEDFQLTLPCHIANIREAADGLLFGLTHDFADEETRQAYRQLIDVLALGSTLKLQSKSEQPDVSGYLVESYAGEQPSRLTVWRHPEGGSVAAFEFQLKDSLVRGAAGRPVRYLTGTNARPATVAKAQEIQRLFNWVLPNLAPAVPADVREFLEQFAD